MNTIDILGDDETLKRMIERTITEFEDNELLTIGKHAFSKCSKLTSVSLPVATSIGDSAFSECSKLTSVSLPVATSIERSAFYVCKELTSISLPKAATIKSSVFYHCYGLTSVSLPKATSIESAFDGCSNLTTLYIGTESDRVCTLSSTGAIPSNVTDIYVPAALADSYKTATNWSSFADKIKWYEQPVACQSLTITADDVAGYQTTTTIHWEATCTYSIEGIMQPGTMVFKGDVTSDAFGKNPSSDSSRSIEVSYTFLGQTATTTITQGRCVGDPTGGTIFYIDSSADGVYEFYDINGELISDVAVGDKPSSYKIITPGSKDKYYILHEKLYGTSLGWTYSNTGGNTHEYTNLGTKTAIGTGKSNTDIVLAADNGAYIREDPPTIWYQLQQVRNAYTNGCNDWFVPSMGEAGEVRKAGLMALEFNNNYIWSSSETNSTNAYMWKYYDQIWSHQYKNVYGSVFVVRAF